MPYIYSMWNLYVLPSTIAFNVFNTNLFFNNSPISKNENVFDSRACAIKTPTGTAFDDVL